MSKPDDPSSADAHAEVRRNVRRLMEGFDTDYWAARDRGGEFPDAFFDAVADAGYFGTLLPADHGGADAGPGVASVVVEEINRAGGDATAINAQMLIPRSLLRDGSDAQRERYLSHVATGNCRFLTVAATEPDSGADMSSLQSTAKRDGDGWVLQANKVFISMAEHTRVMLVLVTTDEGPTIFLLDRDEVGGEIELRPIDMVTNRMTTMLFIDGLRVGDDARLGPVGGGLKCLMKGFAVRRAMAAAECIGNARFMLDRSLAHARERVTYDRPIGQNQGVQYPLAQAYAKVEAADLMRWDALARATAGDPDASARSAMAKVLASEAAWETARAALTTFGGWGLTTEYQVERKLRESTVYVFNNMLLSYLSHNVLGLPKAF